MTVYMLCQWFKLCSSGQRQLYFLYSLLSYRYHILITYQKKYTKCIEKVLNAPHPHIKMHDD